MGNGIGRVFRWLAGQDCSGETFFLDVDRRQRGIADTLDTAGDFFCFILFEDTGRQTTSLPDARGRAGGVSGMELVSLFLIFDLCWDRGVSLFSRIDPGRVDASLGTLAGHDHYRVSVRDAALAE